MTKSELAEELWVHLKVGCESCGILFHVLLMACCSPVETGLPISVKDHYNMEGFDNSCGIAHKCFKPAKETGAFVQSLINAGAIPFVRSNVPQLMMLPERFDWRV